MPSERKMNSFRSYGTGFSALAPHAAYYAFRSVAQKLGLILEGFEPEKSFCEQDGVPL